jgi:hypothetical protein
MSDSELALIESLLVRVLPDPMGFLERATTELAGRLTTPAAPTAEPTLIDADPEPPDQALADQVVLLAAALGACECWGHDPGCRTCSGAGRPGWTTPNPDLYREFVQPAVQRDSAAPAPTTERPTDPAPADQLIAGGRA